MAFFRLSLLCFVVVFLGLATVNSCNEIENSRNAEGVRDSRNPYIYKRDEHEKRLATDRGEVLAVPIFRESSILEKDLVNYELNCLHIRPNSFMLPHYSTALRILFVQQGRARVGWVRGGKLREEDLETGSVVLIPIGSVFYAINKDQVENLVIVNLLHNPNPYTNRHHESFYIGGGRNPPSILSAFRRETLAAAFNTAGRNIERLLSKQDEGAFASLRNEQMRKLIVSSDHEIQNIPFWNRASKTIEEEYKPFNLLKKKPRFSNNYGQYISAEDEDLVKSLLDREEVGIRYTKIEPRAMSVPNWESHATRISVVVSGRGRVEIASPEGTQQQRKGEGEGEGQKQEETEEGGGGEFTVSYKRVEDDVQEGDVVVVPAGHPLVQISSSNQRLEILTFLINDDERNTMNFLAGKNSVTRAVKHEILAASFKASEQEVKKTLESQEEQIFVKGPSERESESESGGSRAIL